MTSIDRSRCIINLDICTNNLQSNELKTKVGQSCRLKCQAEISLCALVAMAFRNKLHGGRSHIDTNTCLTAIMSTITEEAMFSSYP